MDGEGSCDRMRVQATLQSESESEEVSKWFEEGGKCICFRGKTAPGKDEPWYLFTLSAQCLSDCFLHLKNNLKNNNNNKRRRKSSFHVLFNHSLRHAFPIHFQLSHRHVPLKFAELYDASWVVLDSTIYFFGSTNRKIYYLNRNVADNTFPGSLRFKKAGRMISKRMDPKVVALDGKIYVFSKNKNGLWGEVFEPYENSFEGKSEPLAAPLSSTISCDVSFVVAIEKEKKIVVGFHCTLVDEVEVKYVYPNIEENVGIAVYVYNVLSKYWVKHEKLLIFNHRGHQCMPIAVGSCLYWLDEKLRAYDLESKRYYEGPIEDSFLQHVLETSKKPKHMASLFHLFGDYFCMTWGHWKGSILHCTMIQALRTNTNLQASNRFELCTTVVSCQTFVSDLSPSIQGHALVLQS